MFEKKDQSAFLISSQAGFWVFEVSEIKSVKLTFQTQMTREFLKCFKTEKSMDVAFLTLEYAKRDERVIGNDGEFTESVTQM